MTEPLDFQSVIMTLQKYWASQGCLIWQPYYSQIGAGTMNPGTFLRVLGPEPWNVAYVEPSVRPDDGRYGENPNRFQQHYQFQVILKPDPGNPQGLYLKSLEALGIDAREHDIRFVEDNWQQPALGAWGLGWEVWLDGQEITQFTYFQQAGGLTLDPVSVEITYGLERITMPLQRVSHFRKMHWNQQHTYGDVNYQGEVEHSKYYFEIADVDRMRQLYKLYEAEAESALNNGLVLPAHDYILKCSHTFNILDTRGAVGVTERQALFGRMRELARRTSEAYVEQRRAMEYPLIAEGTAKPASASAAARPASLPKAAAPFLLEIGTEELPGSDFTAAVEQLKTRVPAMLDELRLAHGEIEVIGTPRRLVVRVAELASEQQTRTTVVKGPPKSRAYDETGQPTRALEGFAQGKGVAVADLEAREVDGGVYIVALVQEASRSAYEVLLEALPALAAGIKFDKSMRWNFTNVPFSRPVRWLVALLGDTVIPFEFAGLRADAQTHGLRFMEPEVLPVKNTADLEKALAAQGIILDPAKRKEIIRQQVLAISKKVGGSEKLDEGLLDEVTLLVEAPFAFLGTFEESHLQLPPEVLISVMKKHQRYFPVQTADGKLLPHFIAVRNGGEQGIDLVTDGNEQVVRARFADANFFIREDLKHPLESMLTRLGTLTFQQKLGSMLEKSQRITALVEALAPGFGLSGDDLKTAKRAATLSKADLVTHMVVEMTSLQGVMGRYYARYFGEPEAVAQALYDQYLPRFAGDALPSNKIGLALGLADRLDSLTGLFAAGLAPTGTKDPFAQRRAALGLVQSLGAFDLDIDLRDALKKAAAQYTFAIDQKSLDATLEFIIGRLKSSLTDQGYRYDVVDAVLAEQGHNPAGVYRAVKELSAWIARGDWVTILPAFSRCVRITRDQKQHFTVDPTALVEPSEKDLSQSLQAIEKSSRRQGSVDDLFNAFVPLIPQVNRFFDDVLVMAEDARLRSNRLGLLQHIAGLAKGIVDLSCLEGF